jgi:hypothetical protein
MVAPGEKAELYAEAFEHELLYSCVLPYLHEHHETEIRGA